MSDDTCQCARCQQDTQAEPLIDGAVSVLSDAMDSLAQLNGLSRRQSAAIDELVHLIGYLPQAHAVLEKHGLR
jgi:hypothetical protein